jgi:hypothetical protein
MAPLPERVFHVNDVDAEIDEERIDVIQQIGGVLGVWHGLENLLVRHVALLPALFDEVLDGFGERL